MTDVERAEYVMGLSAATRDGLHSAVSMLTEDQDEKEQIAGAVVAQLLREMYRARGRRWLEAVVAMALR